MLFMSDCNQNRNLSTNFGKSHNYDVSRKSFRLESLWPARKERRTQQIVPFRSSSANAPKMDARWNQ